MPQMIIPGQDASGQMQAQQDGPQMILPGQQMPGQQMPGQPMQGQPMQGQPMGPMPGQPMPGQPMQGQPMGQGQPMPGQPMTQGQQVPMRQGPAQIQNQMPGQVQGQAMGQVQGPQMQPQPMQGQPMPGQPMMQNGQQQDQQAGNIGSAAIAAQKAAPNSPTKESPTSTQATLLISELRDNVVIMKDGSFRAVVACKSINFDLMSEMEREGVEYSYQNFLNSLKFTTQILIRSQRVDIGPYIERLSEIRRNNDNMLLGVLMDDYINFIDILSQEANIMDKSFFIVIPYYTSEDAEKGLQETKNFFKTFSKGKGPEITKIDRATYDKALTELTNRVDAVMSGLFQIGIQSVRLTTKELAELYYNYNNPDTAVREPLVDFSKLATLYVKKGDKTEKGKQLNG